MPIVCTMAYVAAVYRQPEDDVDDPVVMLQIDGAKAHRGVKEQGERSPHAAEVMPAEEDDQRRVMRQ